MNTLKDLMQEREAQLAAMEALLDKATRERRDVTSREQELFKDGEDELDRLENEIREIRNDKREVNTMTIKTKRTDTDFRNVGEFFNVIAANPADPRLKELRTLQMNQGTLGGFAVPEQFLTEIYGVESQGGVVRPRATVLERGDPPDSPMSLPALDQANGNTWGGFTVYHQDELKTLTTSDISLRMVTLSPHKLTGYIRISNELLRNWDASSLFLSNQMNLAKIAAEDTDFLFGSGVNRAKGVINSDCAIDIARETANEISYTDVVSMLSRILMRADSAPVWVASQTTIPQLANIRDAGNNNLWIQSAKAGLPVSFLSYPLIFSDRSPALGTKGDLMLLDLKRYLIKDGSGPLISTSEHVNFTTDETAFRLIWYTDGQSALLDPITLEGNTTTVSPFVILGA